MVQTKTPIIQGWPWAYAYVNGQFYWSDGTHPELLAFFRRDGSFKHDDIRNGVFGYVYATDEGDWINEVMSDFMPLSNMDMAAEAAMKMEEMLPGVVHDYGGKRLNANVNRTSFYIVQPVGTETSEEHPELIEDEEPAILSRVAANLTGIQQAIANDPAAQVVVDVLTAAGGTVYVVGGAVRDAVLGKDPKDVDFMVTGLTGDQIEQTLKPLGPVNLTGKDFGVYRFRQGDHEVEIALPRTERSTGSGHKDFAVQTDPFMAPEDDLYRRDFTVNAMGYDPLNDTLLDPFGGMDDANNGRLRLVNPDAFKDDPLRIVRALVAQARHGLEPEQDVLESIAANAHRLRHLPGERVQMELDKLLGASDPVRALEIAAESGLLDYLAPELSATVGFDQRNPHHDLDVFSHTMQVLGAMAKLTDDPDMRLAALFHDSGKPDSFWLDEGAPEGGGGHFYKKVLDDGTEIGGDHEEVGADLADAFMRRLKYPNDRRERVVTLVRNHMFPYFNSSKGARKFLNALNGDEKMARDLLLLRMSDASGKKGGQMSEYDQAQIETAMTLLDEVMNSDQAFTIKNLAVNGHDMMQLGLKGPMVGQALKKLLDLVIDNPELNTRDQLLAIVRDGV